MRNFEYILPDRYDVIRHVHALHCHTLSLPRRLETDERLVGYDTILNQDTYRTWLVRPPYNCKEQALQNAYWKDRLPRLACEEAILVYVDMVHVITGASAAALRREETDLYERNLANLHAADRLSCS